MGKTDVVIVDTVRTPFGLYLGQFASLNARGLSEHALRDLLARNSAVDPETIDEVVAGWALADFYAPNIARVAALDAGFPESTIGTQLTSGMQALEYATNRIRAGEGELYAVFGVESSSSVNNALPKTAEKRELLGPRTLIDPLWELMHDAQTGLPLGVLANQLGFTREEADEYAVLSHKRAFKHSKKYAKKEFTSAIEIPDRPIYDGMPAPGTSQKITADEGVRMGVEASSFASSQPLREFMGSAEGGLAVTAENMAQYADGAVAALVMSGEKAKSLGLDCLASIEQFASTGTPKGEALLAPSYALEALLTDADLAADDLALLELHESYAVQVLANQRRLAGRGYDFSMNSINVNGGAVAFGDPYAATSLRMVAQLAHQLAREGKEYGAAAVMTQAGVGRAVLLRRG